MSDSLGPIVIVDPPVIGAFPLRGDFGSGSDVTPPIAIHVFDQPGLQTEQRYLLGNGARRFRVRKDHLSCNEYDSLKTHWLQAQGQYASFPYQHWGPGGSETVSARYENPNLSIDQLVGLVTGDPGVTLLEVPTIIPAYAPSIVVTRFPDSALTTALTAQVQRFVPLIVIQPRDGSAALYLSDRRCNVTVPGQAQQLYLPRLLTWSGISQTLGEASDSASFTFGNADGVWTQLANQVNLARATIRFALLHLNSNYLISLWAGVARPWTMDASGQFQLPASDGVFELGLGYPGRQLGRTCWKVYQGRFCPSISALPDCPKDFASCVARGVPKSFGGIVALPQTVRIADNSTGVFGFGRSHITSVSIAEDSVYQRPVQEVYTDTPMKVTCDVAAGRDESEFYSALGIVGEGPLGAYDTNLLRHTLDGQPPHDPQHGGGWRGILGNDPASDADFFGLDQAPWTGVPAGSTYAGGLAFAEIRRTDQKGLQLATVSDRAMTVTVTQGISGWVWTAPGARVYTAGLANPVWVAINVYLRAIGLRVIPANAGSVTAAEMEQYFDVAQAIAAAAICDLLVNKLVGSGQERQFPFRGVLKEKKALKDWLQEILNCCLGYYTFVAGKLWIGIRVNSGVLPGNAFTRAHILFKTLQASPLTPQFNWLVGQFGDEEFDWALNAVTIYDEDHAKFAGNAASPQYLPSTMNFVGISNKSQCARVITTRLREEIGGVGPAEQAAARNLRFQTTLLALQTMVGDIVSLTDPRLPNGYTEGRVQSWVLNPDYSVDIQTTCTTDAMYDLTVGPKPVDAVASPVPPAVLPSASGLTWMPNEVAPVALDPLYTDILQRTFDLWQDYSISRDGKWEAAVIVAGQMCINDFAFGQQPRILAASLAAGGTLTGPMTVYIAITQRLNTLQPLAPSNMIGLWIPAGLSNRKVTLTVAASPDSDPPWDLWAGNDRRTIAWQSSGTNVQPTVDFLGPIHKMTKGLPEAAARKVAIAAKHVWHSGVAGVSVTTVIAPNKIRCSDFQGSTDNWVGRILSALADFSDGSAPLWNFTVTGFTPGTGEFTVSPDCVRLAFGTAITYDFTTGVLPAGITFTRPSIGTYFNAAGILITAGNDVARFNYVGGVANLLIEPSATNLSPWSNKFSFWGAANGAVVTAAQFVSPDGTNDGWSETSGSGNGYVNYSITNSLVTYTSSIWAKQIAGSTQLMFLLIDAQSAPIAISPVIARYSFTRTPTVANTAGQSFVVTGGAGTHGIFGAQLETGFKMTSYIPTAGSPVTRAADSASFTIPAGVTQLTYTFDDNSTQTVAVSAGSYTIPTNLNRPNIKSIAFLGNLPDPANSVDQGDVLIVRSMGMTATANSVKDPLWHNTVALNQFNAPGLAVNAEIGSVARILFGTGAGQVRYITGNSVDTLTVSPNWDTLPDATSVVIVEDPDWSYQTRTSDLDVPFDGARIELRMRLNNLENQVALVGGFLVDDQDRLSDEVVAPMREIFIYGQPPGVRVVGPGALDPVTGVAWTAVPTDQTIRVDTSARDITVQLLPIADYQGRTLYFSNDTGPHNATVQSAGGEKLFDGATSVTLAPNETVRVTAG